MVIGHYLGNWRLENTAVRAANLQITENMSFDGKRNAPKRPVVVTVRLNCFHHRKYNRSFKFSLTSWMLNISMCEDAHSHVHFHYRTLHKYEALIKAVTRPKPDRQTLLNCDHWANIISTIGTWNQSFQQILILLQLKDWMCKKQNRI